MVLKCDRVHYEPTAMKRGSRRYKIPEAATLGVNPLKEIQKKIYREKEPELTLQKFLPEDTPLPARTLPSPSYRK